MPAEMRGEDEGEGGEGLVVENPIGEYYGGRNDKNERHGRGRAKLPNGDIYLGTYFKGKRHGLGVYKYKNGNGARYGGDWTLSVKEGWGTFYYPDGSQYTGNWERGLKHGWGVYVYPNGDEYEGWWYQGHRNGRGIYRNKANGEKFVGGWVLGKRQGSGMIIRKEHRFIGTWYNDIPRGSGVYIFPELGVEQRGKYVHIRALPDSVEKWKDKGYQVRYMRSAPPPADPLRIENERYEQLTRISDFLEDLGESGGEYDDLTMRYLALKPKRKESNNSIPLYLPAPSFEDIQAHGDGRVNSRGVNGPSPSFENIGEGAFDEDGVLERGSYSGSFCEKPLSTGPGPCDVVLKKDECRGEGGGEVELEVGRDIAKETADLIFEYMQGVVAAEMEPNSVVIPVVLVWRAIEITPIQTELIDETVPPPPMPMTPAPLPEPAVATQREDPCKPSSAEEEVDAIARAKLLAKTHKLEDVFMGSGVCEETAAGYKRSPADELAATYSSLSLSNMEEFRLNVEVIGQNFKQAIPECGPAVIGKTRLDATKKWCYNLEDNPECEDDMDFTRPHSAGVIDKRTSRLTPSASYDDMESHKTEIPEYVPPYSPAPSFEGEAQEQEDSVEPPIMVNSQKYDETAEEMEG